MEVSKEGLEELLPLVGAVSNDLVTYDLLKAYYKDEDLLKAYYKDEDDDLQWAQQQLDLIDTVGYQNWLTQQL
ncbi:Bacterioferritin (cytochrome b1) [Streptococcus infantarius subsp. infantarius]|nr:Bacterioferritin (cytochrome b1) [Streptococcus infantarius subsp. infantarius]